MAADPAERGPSSTGAGPDTARNVLPRAAPTEDEPRRVVLTMSPTARFILPPFRARELGRELIRVADEIVTGGTRGFRPR